MTTYHLTTCKCKKCGNDVNKAILVSIDPEDGPSTFICPHCGAKHLVTAHVEPRIELLEDLPELPF